MDPKWRFQSGEAENFLAVQWLGLRTFTADGPGSILVQELRSCKLHSMVKKESGGVECWALGDRGLSSSATQESNVESSIEYSVKTLVQCVFVAQ